jgi:hypothetical protein
MQSIGVDANKTVSVGVKVKLSLRLTKHNTMTAYGAVAV